MSSELVIDTETTKLFRDNDPDGPPRIAELSAVYCEDGRIQWAFSTLIKPTGWTITDEAAAINKIRMEDLERHGIPIEEAFDMIVRKTRSADTVLVAHNINFDLRMVRVECSLTGHMLSSIFDMMPRFCTMLRTGFSHVKLGKKLHEAYFGLYGHAMPDAHAALSDAMGCLQVYKGLHARHALSMKEEVKNLF